MNDPSPEPPNPYAPPSTTKRVHRAEPFPSPWLSGYVALQLSAVSFLGAAGAGLGQARVLVIASLTAVALALVVWLVWLSRQWRRLPARLQMVGKKGVTPAQAALRHLIPVYSIYWIFAVNAALCDGINQMLARKGRPLTAPVTLSRVCPATVMGLRTLSTSLHGVALVMMYAVLGALWVSYMVGVERALSIAKRRSA